MAGFNNNDIQQVGSSLAPFLEIPDHVWKNNDLKSLYDLLKNNQSLNSKNIWTQYLSNDSFIENSATSTVLSVDINSYKGNRNINIEDYTIGNTFNFQCFGSATVNDSTDFGAIKFFIGDDLISTTNISSYNDYPATIYYNVKLKISVSKNQSLFITGYIDIGEGPPYSNLRIKIEPVTLESLPVGLFDLRLNSGASDVILKTEYANLKIE